MTERLKNYVSMVFGITVDKLLSRSRERNAADARHCYQGVLKEYCDKNGIIITTTQAGALLKRDHSTAIYNRKMHKTLFKTDIEYRFKAHAVWELIDTEGANIFCRCGKRIKHKELGMCNDCYAEQAVRKE